MSSDVLERRSGGIGLRDGYERSGPFGEAGADTSFRADQRSAELQLLRALNPVPFGYPLPTADTIAVAARVLAALASSQLDPRRIGATVEGGIGMNLGTPMRDAYIECDNDGAVLVSLIGGDPPRPVWEEPLDSDFVELARRIHEYITG